MEPSPFLVIIVLSLKLFAPIIGVRTSCMKNGGVKTNAPNVQIDLTCSKEQWIHVISEKYGNRTSVSGCLNTAQSCIKLLQTDAQGLIVNCNGKQICSEIMSDPADCTPTLGYEIEYECVKDSIDVCSTQETSTKKTIYLHSTGFPGSAEVNDSCHCRIIGKQMSVLLIEHRHGTRDLNISTDGDTALQGFTTYNRYIAQKASYAELNYHGTDDGRFWIKVIGADMMNVTCSNETDITPTSPMDTTTVGITEESSAEGGVGVTISTTSLNPTTTEGHTNDGGVSVTTSTTSRNLTTTEGKTNETHDGDSHTTPEPHTMDTEKNDGDPNPHTKDTDTPLSTIAIASIGTTGGFVVAVLIIVTVICCRHARKSNEGKMLGQRDTDPVQLGYINRNPGQCETNGYMADHNYFQLDPAFVSAEAKKEHNETREGPTSSTKSPVITQYAKVVPGSSTVLVCDISTSRVDGNQANASQYEYVDSSIDSQDQYTEEKKCDMVDNDIYVGGPASKEKTEEGMMDNFLYHTFKRSGDDTTHEAKNPSDESSITEEPIYSEDELGDEEERMVINDLYHSSKSPTADQTEHKFYSGVDGTSGGDQREGMVINDLYHSYPPSLSDQPSGRGIQFVSLQSEQQDNSDDQDDDTEGMVINDLYHSFQPSFETKIPNVKRG